MSRTGNADSQMLVQANGTEIVCSGRRALGPHGGRTAVHCPRTQRPVVLSRGRRSAPGPRARSFPAPASPMAGGRARGWRWSRCRPHPRCLPLPGGERGQGPDTPCRPHHSGPDTIDTSAFRGHAGPQELRQPTGTSGTWTRSPELRVTWLLPPSLR